MNILKRYIESERKIRKNTDEILWARIWNDTKIGIPWIEGLQSVSPGRWAVGYNYLYIMTRILNEMNPHSVLDLGLGLSSTLISCYFDYYNFSDGIHTIIEHNEDWIQFYLNKHPLSKASRIIYCKCIEKSINGNKYKAYADIDKIIKGKKYSVISIDAPEGASRYSRRDILQLLPDILDNSFVIIMDDADRKGEQDTISEIKSLLRKCNVTYYSGIYESFTNCCVITSADNKFFCTL